MKPAPETAWSLLACALCATAEADSPPFTVQSGAASAVTTGNQRIITASDNAFLSWPSFNIQRDEITRFVQPSAASVVWNRIQDSNPSSIQGGLVANGIVVLMNRSGFYFGPDSFVNAAGLVVSTAVASPLDAQAGLFWQFNGAPPEASIVNYGHIDLGPGGAGFFIADRIENHGQISAPGGTIGLLAGGEVLLSSRPDGKGLSAKVTLPSGSVDNQGKLLADGGSIALRAKVVNQGGLIQADTVREVNGVIELTASEAITLGAQSELSASGPKDGAGNAGRVEIKSQGTFEDADGPRIRVSGGSEGGNGGFVELSAPSMAAIHSSVDSSAARGWTGGELLIDPNNITLGMTGAGSAGNGNVGVNDPPKSGTLNLDVTSAFTGFSRIVLQAANNITVASGTVWDLANSTGIDSVGSLLRLEAGNNLTVANGASILGGQRWSIQLLAGRDFATPDGVKSGVGNLALNGTAGIETREGGISLKAGNNITLASGFARTTAGGNIVAEAVAGSINTGSKANGFLFRPSGYDVDTDLGGISTAAGGNVTLKAGLDITSFLPSSGGVQTDAGSGAFGTAHGDVTIEAGRDVSGHFVVRNGSGKITAGRNAGTSSKLLALSLVDGGWSVDAAQDVLLQEVRNPNGVFNNLGIGSSTTKHFFDYAADAFVSLKGGNSVQLRGTALPRYPDTFEKGITPIYPGTLGILAGAGGVSLGNDVTLFSSPYGNLTIITTGGGSLLGTRDGELTHLTVSDSAKTQYRAFGDFGVTDHAATPIHLNDDQPVSLDISGDMNAILLAVPKAATVHVGGNMTDTRFEGQNLHATDHTSIDVVGDVFNHNEFTPTVATTTPDFSVFDLAYPPLSGALSGMQNLFFYDATTHTLTFKGRMTGDQLDALKSLQVRTFDENGSPILKPDGEPVTRPAEFVDQATLQRLFDASSNVLLDPDTGYRIGGGGLFSMTARNLDLGATAGIVSQGPRGNAALAKLFDEGADIKIDLTGSLDMFYTKIASVAGGNITLNAAGHVDVGSTTAIPGDQAAKGIFSAGSGNIDVVAKESIHVNGSRIAAYDGGNVTVRSLEGDVDAGSGASGSATVEKLYVNPVTKEVLSYTPTIPGSGILATTFPPSLDPAFPTSQASVGDILVETPRGDIKASAGGIVQLPLNGVGTGAGNVTLRAGTKDADGKVIYEGNIDAEGSGVIGSTVKLEATGNIVGLVFARNNLDISANQNVNVTALAVGSANVTAGETITGTVVGVGAVTASATSVDASLLSQNVTTTGDAAQAQVGFAQGTAAAATSQSLEKDDAAKPGTSQKSAEDESWNKKQTGPKLARTVGRVTVVLPVSSQRK